MSADIISLRSRSLPSSGEQADNNRLRALESAYKTALENVYKPGGSEDDEDRATRLLRTIGRLRGQPIVPCRGCDSILYREGNLCGHCGGPSR